MLPFHETIVADLVESDGLAVLAVGLALPKVLAALVRLHSHADGVLLLLSISDSQKQFMREELQECDPAASLPVEINNEYTAADRVNFYADGGAFFITSRILIVDMLNERVPLHRVAGIILGNAHRLSETCAEAFIVRLFRQVNKKGYVRAFSDRPQAMISGFSKTERVMKSLFVKKLHLWPRFELSVSSVLEASPPEVVDIRIPLSAAMSGIQNAILEVMDACLKELRKSNKVDVEDLTVENGLFKSFDEIIRFQLDPIWHTIGRKTKQLVADLKTLRKLAEYLLRYDAVTFLKYLDTLRVSEGVRSVWMFANPTHRIFELAKRRVYQLVRTDIETIIPTEKLSKRRKSNSGSVIPLGASTSGNVLAGGDTENGQAVETPEVVLELVVEEMPKWKLLREVLEEIYEERRNGGSRMGGIAVEDNSSVLVACKDERTCLQLQDLVAQGSQKVMKEQWNRYLLGKAELHGVQMRNRRRHRGKGGGSTKGVGVQLASAHSKEQKALLAAAAKVAALDKEGITLVDIDFGEHDQKGSKGRGKGRGRGVSKTRDRSRGGRGGRGGRGRGKEKEEEKVVEVIELSKDEDNDNDFTEPSGRMKAQTVDEPDTGKDESVPADTSTMDQQTIIGDSEQDNKGEKSVPPVHFYALDSEQRVLQIVRPEYVIVFDPDMGFVRELEVYKAENPSRGLKVYFLFYENSTEVRKFEASIRRENSAFESLIRQKATMMIPLDQDGRMLDLTPPPQSATGVSLNPITRKAGGRKAVEKKMRVVVDMREFGSSLPCVLHQQGMQIFPVTLEVGDYILSPEICVERKSISDLFSSFASGRLYHQAETMIRYYRIPVLLIEFSQDKSFSLQSANDVGEDITPSNVISKISLLVLHFPRLRIVWSRSLHATADIFTSLKSNQDEPDVDKAMRVGVPTEDGLIEGDLRAENYNTSAIELLRRLPGVTDANYRSLMDGCKSLAELVLLPVEKLAELMGGQRQAQILHDFLHAKCPAI